MVKLKVKELSEKIIQNIGIYGAIIGAFSPFVYSVLSITALPGTAAYIPAGKFYFIYYLRIILAITAGTLVGGFSSAFATKIGLTMIKKVRWWKGLLAGLILGGIVGFLTAGSTPLALLIESSDFVWAIEVIKRAAIAGTMVGSFAGAIAGTFAAVYFTDKEKKKILAK